ncbi:conjugative transfer signal peptidase TraF [Vibrio parahaemolyticus]|uniref:conjugative transfer signal peptidase TraF n=1 Tax=Vibrio parahaemolyticus TaxID=670 RepID=UPI0004DF8E3D|nr:conjugative transfer signal peptidase TraF [Vibrio parahaemolyticus]
MLSSLFKKRLRFIIRLFVGSSVLILGASSLYLSGYRYYNAPSIPTGIYQISVKNTPYVHEDWVLFCPPNNLSMKLAVERGYTAEGICPGNFTPVIKQIIATPGDYISLEGIVRVNGHELQQALVLDEDEHHHALPHRAPFVLQQGEFFMMSNHLPASSFDSRYYGPVPSKNILAWVSPVWVW